MATLICNHCDDYSCDYSSSDAIMWCGPCITLDYRLIDAHSLIHNAGAGLHFIWINANSIYKISSIPKKKKATIAVPFDVSMSCKTVEKKPCSRAYYGMPECTCGKCPPKRHATNTNPFRYGS